LCRLLGRGRVIGIDVEIRPHNRSAIEEHPLFDLITLVEGSSTDPEVVTRVEGDVAGAETVLVLLDSAHTKAHVRAELEAYAPLVTVGSYVVVMDGIMQLVAGVPRAGERWDVDNPVTAIEEFVAANPSFVVQQPSWEFNESELRENVTHWPSGYLRRIA
jgi:cephalosporin hydroxylase